MLAVEARRLWEAGRAAFPDVPLDLDVFVAHLARRLGGDADLAALHVGDLYLACACVSGQARAIAHFERLHIAQVGSYVARIDGAPEFVDELVQVLRTRLLVGEDDRPPRIVGYSGRGPLGGWVRVAAVRAAIDLKALHRDDPIPVADLGETLSTAPDAEMQLLRARYVGDLQAALETALGRLAAKDRALLRHYVVDQMSLDQLAVIYSVHRATIWRWLTAARTQVIDSARALLGERLGLPAEEFSSLMRALRSQLRVSMARAFGRR